MNEHLLPQNPDCKTLENLLYLGISQAFNPKALIVAVAFGRSSDFPIPEAFPSYSCLAFFQQWRRFRGLLFSGLQQRVLFRTSLAGHRIPY